MEFYLLAKKKDTDGAWGNEREVILVRQGKGSFGISIVGGKVSH